MCSCHQVEVKVGVEAVGARRMEGEGGSRVGSPATARSCSIRPTAPRSPLSFASAAPQRLHLRLRRLERLARRAQLAVALLLARAHQRVRVAEQRELARISIICSCAAAADGAAAAACDSASFACAAWCCRVNASCFDPSAALEGEQLVLPREQLLVPTHHREQLGVAPPSRCPRAAAAARRRRRGRAPAAGYGAARLLRRVGVALLHPLELLGEERARSSNDAFAASRCRRRLRRRHLRLRARARRRRGAAFAAANACMS